MSQYSSVVAPIPLPGQRGNGKDRGTYSTNDNYSTGKVPNVDDRLGVRPRQPTALQTIRRPITVINVECGNNTTGAPVSHYLPGNKQMNNIVGIYIAAIHISGYSNTAFTASHNNALISLGSSDFHHMQSARTLNLGTTGTPQYFEGFSVPIVPTSTDTLLEYTPSRMMALFQQPQSMSNIALQVLDCLGNAIAYSELFITFEIETEDWQ